ncbi:uncharacterized protein LOC126108246 [Schistocerca cancellata]|uniref:uncharacterized protein LOC126108246 n=1 Tax=Schistocerca cancellata TaxID=274614 RepID=UPI00211779AB|nr:uncharacterized protein LOC126108246 [Schistocerca cancellata]
MALQVILFMTHRGRTQQLVLRLLQARRLFPEDRTGSRTRHQRIAERLGLGYQVSVMVPALLWVLTPALVDAMSAPAANGTAATRGTPLPVWAPFDLQRSPNYELVYAVQAVTNVVMNLTGLFLDVFFVTLMLHLTAELDVLNLNVASLRPSPVAPADSLESRDGDSLAKQASTDAPYTARGDSFRVRTSTSRFHMYRLLVKNIQHHQMIIM